MGSYPLGLCWAAHAACLAWLPRRQGLFHLQGEFFLLLAKEPHTFLSNSQINTSPLYLGVQRVKKPQKVSQGLGGKPVCLRSMLILLGWAAALEGQHGCMLHSFV